MTGTPISYDDVLLRLREAEEEVQALLTARAGAIVTAGEAPSLRLHETHRALHLAKASLERLLDDRTEAALAGSERRLRILLESASEAVVAIDEAGRIALVNATTEKMFGWTRQELIGAPLEKLFGRSLAELEAMSLERREKGPFEFGAHRKDGTPFPVELSLSFSDDQGERLALALLTDITERKREEASLQETQKLESIGTLAGGVAHDFNNLLTIILGHATLLAHEVPGHARSHLDAVIGGAEKAAHITRQLLAYSGKGHFHITDLDLAAIVRQNADLIRVSIPKSIEIRLDLKDGLPRVRADAGQMQQVLMNLVINAAEAIGDNANGTITISARHEEMESSARGVLLMVTDTGCGMEEATKARIFDPFFTTKVLGRGLGLSAVLGILRSCSASIHVDSRAGEGATFRLLFPAAESKSAQAVPESRRPEAARRGTVLVVEDEDMVRSFASAALKRAGYKVLLAAQGQEAVELIRANGRVDVVLLDVTMPVMSGRETFTQIKQLRPGMVVIVTSGHGVQHAERLMELQGDEAKFLQKPYTVDGLVQFVNAALPK